MKKTGILCRIFSLLLTGILLFGTVSVQAGTRDTEDLRGMQEEILDWHRAVAGGKEILNQDLLERAGQASSDWYAFDISRIGLEDSQAVYLGCLKKKIENIYEDPEESKKKYKVSDFCRMILAIEACGGNAEAFGEDADHEPVDLVRDTIWTSFWGQPEEQGLNGYIWCLIAADSQDFQEPEDTLWTRESFVEALQKEQHSDGGFGLSSKDRSDPDLTAMVLTALAPYQKETASTAEKAFAYLEKQQREDGSIATHDLRTSESTAWVILALSSWGYDPEETEQFRKDGKTLLDGIRSFQLPDGSMIHSTDEEETTGNDMASYQTLYGLESVIRMREGRNGIFDLSDAKDIPEEEIEKAEQAFSSGKKEGSRISRILLILLILFFTALFLKPFFAKKKRNEKKKDAGNTDEEW